MKKEEQQGRRRRMGEIYETASDNSAETARNYGDEGQGYGILARDMSPQEARDYLERNGNDGLVERMNQNRVNALRTRAEEGGESEDDS